MISIDSWFIINRFQRLGYVKSSWVRLDQVGLG